MRINIEECFKRAKVATRINDIIEQIEPERESIWWPQLGSVVPTINASAGPNDNQQNPQKCGYCGFWDHRSNRCETPHYLCSYAHEGKCMERRPPSHDDIADEQDFGNTLYNDEVIE